MIRVFDAYTEFSDMKNYMETYYTT